MTAVRSSYGWDVGPSVYGPSGIIARPERSSAGNVVLHVGETIDAGGWHKVAHVVLSPDETRRLISDLTRMLEPDAPVGPQPPEAGR